MRYGEEFMKPYAIVNLVTLKTSQFDSKDELREAMRALSGRKIHFQALKYFPEPKLYMPLETP